MTYGRLVQVRIFLCSAYLHLKTLQSLIRFLNWQCGGVVGWLVGCVVGVAMGPDHCADLDVDDISNSNILAQHIDWVSNNEGIEDVTVYPLSDGVYHEPKECDENSAIKT